MLTQRIPTATLYGILSLRRCLECSMIVLLQIKSTANTLAILDISGEIPVRNVWHELFFEQHVIFIHLSLYIILGCCCEDNSAGRRFFQSLRSNSPSD